MSQDDGNVREIDFGAPRDEIDQLIARQITVFQSALERGGLAALSKDEFAEVLRGTRGAYDRVFAVETRVALPPGLRTEQVDALQSASRAALGEFSGRALVEFLEFSILRFRPQFAQQIFVLRAGRDAMRSGTEES